MRKQEKQNQPKKLKKNNFKFNIIWIYATIALFFFGLQLFNFDSTKQTSWKEFNLDMLQQKKVEKVVIVNKEVSDVNPSVATIVKL